MNTKAPGRNWAHWFEIPVSDFDRARAFYETIFDTVLEEFDAGPVKMGIFPHKDTGCAICQFPLMYQPGAEGPVVYLNANPDLKIVQDRIQAAGGDIIMPKKQISPEHGFMALFKDTEGNRLALHSDK